MSKGKYTIKKLKEAGIEAITFEEALESDLKDPVFKSIWEEERVQREITSHIIKARVKRGFTQQELADRVKMKQSALARIESGQIDSRVGTLQKIAAGLGKKLEIKLV